MDRRVNEWKAPPRRPITKCAINRRQVVISLAGGEIVYFELDMVSFGCYINGGGGSPREKLCSRNDPLLTYFPLVYYKKSRNIKIFYYGFIEF